MEEEDKMSLNHCELMKDFFHSKYVECCLLRITNNIKDKKNPCEHLYELFYKYEKVCYDTKKRV